MRKRMIKRIQAGLRKCVEEPNRFHRLGHIKSHADGELTSLKASEVFDLTHQTKPTDKMIASWGAYADRLWPIASEGWRIHVGGDNGKIRRIYGCLGPNLKGANELMGEED